VKGLLGVEKFLIFFAELERKVQSYRWYLQVESTVFSHLQWMSRRCSLFMMTQRGI